MRFVVWLVLCGVMYFVGQKLFLSWFPPMVLIGLIVVGVMMSIPTALAYHMCTEGKPPSNGEVLAVTIGSILAGAAVVALLSFLPVNPEGLIALCILAAGFPSWVVVSMMFIPDTYVSY